MAVVGVDGQDLVQALEDLLLNVVVGVDEGRELLSEVDRFKLRNVGSLLLVLLE